VIYVPGCADDDGTHSEFKVQSLRFKVRSPFLTLNFELFNDLKIYPLRGRAVLLFGECVCDDDL
jgi:hypothetical protein